MRPFCHLISCTRGLEPITITSSSALTRRLHARTHYDLRILFVFLVVPLFITCSALISDRQNLNSMHSCRRSRAQNQLSSRESVLVWSFLTMALLKSQWWTEALVSDATWLSAIIRSTTSRWLPSRLGT